MRILIISPQRWGTMHLSKHHYALELANQGHDVFFLEPPLLNWKFTVSRLIKITEVQRGLKIILPNLFFPYNFKFHLDFFYYLTVRYYIKRLESKLERIDQIWSFDLMNNFPLFFFKKDIKKIYFPVDYPKDSDAFKAIKGADCLISIAQEILNEYPSINRSKKLLVNHGVSDVFLDFGKKYQSQKIEVPLKIGISGNFLRPDLDRLTLLKLIDMFPEVHFHLFGPVSINESNIGGSDDLDTMQFITKLRVASNVKIYSVVPQVELAQYFCTIDIFLVCYDVNKDQSNGVNYHKIMEYMAYGKPIVSSSVSAYTDSDLLYMSRNDQSNEKLPLILNNVIDNLPKNTHCEISQRQIDYANSNSYGSNVLRILAFVRDINI
jgi:glycosyltransferase involved in cell wall biosynthesis